jgi:hypothetical protein
MKNRYTYKLLVQSEEKSRNILEMALYVLVAISVLLSIWQFAEQPSPLPLENTERTSQEAVVAEIAS